MSRLYRLSHAEPDESEGLANEPIPASNREPFEPYNYESTRTAPVVCPYCRENAILIDNKAIYSGPGIKRGMVWRCEPCGAHVGCKSKTNEPLGTLADKLTRICRMAAHEALRGQPTKTLRPVAEMNAEQCIKLIRAIAKTESNFAQISQAFATLAAIESVKPKSK